MRFPISVLLVLVSLGCASCTPPAQAPATATGSWTVEAKSDWYDSVWGSSGSDVFAVGWDGLIIHYDGATWSPMDSGVSESLHGMWGSSGRDVFVLGARGTILHYSGTGWVAMESGTARHLQGVWGLPAATCLRSERPAPFATSTG
jgi:hypothetical protein